MSEICKKLHFLFNKIEKFSFPFDESKIPLNGIYILFENGEISHGSDRIVRIGTHTGENQLRSRLFQHFLMQNKDRSIFRKNIGRALLNKSKDDYLSIWELDLTTKESKEKHSHLIDLNKQKDIENNITQYMQKNFRFIVIPVESKEKRLKIESLIVSSVCNCDECRPSKDWLGNFSPKEKIKESGLWQVNELYKKEMDENEFLMIRDIVNEVIKNG